jgi:hypothetical protein
MRLRAGNTDRLQSVSFIKRIRETDALGRRPLDGLIGKLNAFGLHNCGLLSDAQLESIIYAREAHSDFLADSWSVDETFDLVTAARDDAGNAVRFRRGWFLGDGTGAG